ncbi:MAG: DMT family transporter [Holdemanella sp.]|nr:DMT family transporter [Holdemanella sp.]
MKTNELKGHLCALACILVWGTTFISSKILLKIFNPMELLFMRFLIGFMALCIASPKVLKLKNKKEEIWYALCGLTGVCLYYFLENLALTYTYATNVGVIISAAPFFTTILAHFLYKDEPFQWNFFVGFIVAFIGIFLISFNGAKMQLNPLGDLITVIAAFMWAIYSVILKKINNLGHSSLQNTKRIFAWGLFFMLFGLFFFDFKISMQQVLQPTILINLLFLGVIACAGCFVVWNYACQILGSVRCNQYVYGTPIATLIFSSIVLKEKITLLIALGTILTLLGLIISEYKQKGS